MCSYTEWHLTSQATLIINIKQYKMSAKKYNVGDTVPPWMKLKPMGRMNVEWENANARWLIQNNIDGAA